jgi:hypothetical protein
MLLLLNSCSFLPQVLTGYAVLRALVSVSVFVQVSVAVVVMARDTLHRGLPARNSG